MSCLLLLQKPYAIVLLATGRTEFFCGFFIFRPWKLTYNMSEGDVYGR
jgi:hypothetical protein